MDIPFIDTHLSITDQQRCEAAALEVLKVIRPEWEPSQVTFEVYTAGITNKIMSACVDSHEKIIFRVFGRNTEKFIDRDRELNAARKLAENGLAAPLYARFANGFVCGYVSGRTVKADQFKNPEMQKRICATMAAYHNMDTAEIECDKLFSFRKTRDFIKNIDMSSAKNSLGFISQLEECLLNIRALVQPLNEETAFCHNDLLAHNVIFDECSGRVLFIDYEYADFNYALFDIGNHFCEFAGVEEPDYSKCPNTEEMRSFLRIYLEARQGSVDEGRLETMLRRVPLFKALAHLLWSAWAVVQSQNSTLDFDYASYAAIRYEQYKKCLDSYNSDWCN